MKPIHALLLTAGCLLTGCGTPRPKLPPVASARTPATQQPSAQTPLADARRYSSAADVKGAQARVQLSDTRTSIEEYRGRVMSLTDSVRTLQRQGSAAAADLNRLYTEVSQQDVFIESLLSKVTSVQFTLGEERQLREQADVKLNETQNKLVSKEQEAEHLRTQLADAETDIAKATLSAQENFARAQAASSEADKVRGEKSVLFRILMSVTLACVISLIVNFVQFRSSRII